MTAVCSARFTIAALVAALSAACTIERSIPLSKFACSNGGPCPPDGGAPPADLGVIENDAGFPDALVFPDAEPPDTGPPDTGTPDAGLPEPSCGTAIPLPLSGTSGGDTTQERDDYQSSCNLNPGGKDVVLWFIVPGHLSTLSVSTAGSAFDTVLYLYKDQCLGVNDELACDDDGGGADFTSLIQLTNVDPGAYYAVVDGYDNAALGTYALNVAGTIALGAPCDPAQTFFRCEASTCALSGNEYRCKKPKDCPDGIDNDEDGMTDEDAVGPNACANQPVVTCQADQVISTDMSTLLEATATDDGTLTDRRWTMISSPRPELLPDFVTATPSNSATVTLHLAGEHVFRYTAIDDATQAVACQTKLTADTGGDLRVEMFWTPPPMAFDADLDLHLLDLSATRWFDAALDCDARGCQAGLPWDAPGTADDPVHDGNVMMDRGPEVIRIGTPVQGMPGYRVGVYYAYDAGGLGPSDAYVRIHCNGTLAAEYGPVTLVLGDLDDLDGLNSFWEVADVVFDMNGCTVTPLRTRMGGPLIVTSSVARTRR